MEQGTKVGVLQVTDLKAISPRIVISSSANARQHNELVDKCFENLPKTRYAPRPSGDLQLRYGPIDIPTNPWGAAWVRNQRLGTAAKVHRETFTLFLKRRICSTLNICRRLLCVIVALLPHLLLSDLV
jgi:hypothetical protein